MAQILRTENLKIVNKIGGSEVVLFDKLSFSIEEKEWVTISLPHGGGKTSLYKILLSQIKPTSGKVIYVNRDSLDEYDKQKFLKQNITAIPENPTFVENFAVRDWVKFQIELIRPIGYKKRIKDFYKFLEDLGINPQMHLMQLSILKMRKLEMAFSVLADTILLVLDDVEIGLNKNELSELENYLKEINKNKAILMISQSPVWNKYSKKIIRL